MKTKRLLCLDRHKRRRIAVPLSFFTHWLLTKANPDGITRRAPGRTFIPINLISLSATEEISLFVKNGITLSVLHALICYHLSFIVSSSTKKKTGTAIAVPVSLCQHYLSSRSVSRQVFSAEASLTSVFGMGTGGPSP